MKKLIYILDVHCGWCYGNSENINEIANTFKDKIEIEVKVGGMWLGNNAPSGGEGLHQFIKTHSPQMESVTGAYVSPEFMELTKDASYTFSSLEPSCAIVFVKELYPEKTMHFIKEVQKSIFAEGKRLDLIENYLPALERLAIDISAFKENWMSEKNIEKTLNEFSKAKELASGFPTLLLKTEETTQVLASGYFDKSQMIANLNLIVATEKKA